MRAALRPLLAGVVLVATGCAVYLSALRPLAWNRAAASLQTTTERAIDEHRPSRSADLARQALDESKAYATPSTHLWAIHFHRAGAWMLLGNYDSAILEYRRALLFDQRPEIYVNLANALTFSGRREEAFPAALLAARFTRTALRGIEDGLLRSRVEAALQNPPPPCDDSALR